MIMLINKILFVYLRKMILLILFVYLSNGIVAENYIYSYVNLNVRSAPSLNKESEILTVMSIADSALLISEQGDWCQVLYEDVEGYVYKSYTGENFISTPNLEASFEENWMSYIISVNTDEKLLATIEDWGFCGPSDEVEMRLVIYNYSKGEVIKEIFLPYIEDIINSYYYKKYQKIIRNSWLLESCLIQRALNKYGFKELYTDNDSICKKIDYHNLAYQVVIDSLNYDSYKWIGVEKLMHENKELWTSDEMLRKGKYPSSNFSFMMINNECLLLEVEYTNECDCRFFERVVIPIKLEDEKNKLK
jgi:hypothetical protein